MRELSESVYFKSNDRMTGVRWLEDLGIVGYVLRPKGQWVQVFPGWDLGSPETKQLALSKTTGLVVHFFYDTDLRWSAALFDKGQRITAYECDFDTPHCDLVGADPAQAANTLGVSPQGLSAILDGGVAEGWQERAERAAQFVDLLELPNYAYASYHYAHMDAAVTGMDKLFVDLRDDEDDAAPPSQDDAAPPSQQAPQRSAPTAERPPPRKPAQQGDGNAPWQAAYDLASQFLKQLHDQELIELTLDSRLVRDRLIERLTMTVIDNPISNDAQLLALWLDNLMEAPEIVDVYATDDMLLAAFGQAMELSVAHAGD